MDCKNIIVLKRTCQYSGLFSFIFSHITAFLWALNNNYIPVVDMQNIYNMQFNVKNMLHKFNYWNLFFNQPCNIELDQLKEYKSLDFSGNYKNFSDNEIKFLVEKFKNNIHINDEIYNEAKNYYDKFLNDKTIAVMARGTDRKKYIVNGHGIQPNINLIIEDIKKYIDEFNIDKIFLMSEDIEYINLFKKIFGDSKIYMYQTVYFNYKENQTNSKCIENMSLDQKILLNKQYFISFIILMLSNFRILEECSPTSVYDKIFRYTDYYKQAKFEKIYKEIF